MLPANRSIIAARNAEAQSVCRILNHSESSALRIAIIQGAVHIVATIGSIVLVDRIGRKCVLRMLFAPPS